jgi:N-formylglutamate deformylase
MAGRGGADQPVYEFVPGSLPLLISFPHSGTHVPRDIAARLTPDALDLPDTDWHVPELYGFALDLGASLILATHSRYVVDLNRPPDGTPLYPGRRETGVCPLETFHGERLYREGLEPTPAEITARLGAYWQPYHDKLAATIGALVGRHGRCLLWDAHSILSEVPALFDGRLPDLNVGTANGASCSPELAVRLGGILAAQSRFSHVIDGRFKGGFITRHYGRPAQGVEAVQLEIAESAYLVEARRPVFDRDAAAPLGELLRALLEGAALSLVSTAI